ncbi:MAG: hypothetical protein KAJ30_02830, partial [Candidatus Heimdallarchaeota archaeon]|nr:hypothetical protein [Candidatus Heimdallarchaeota archaeon]
PEIFVDIPDFPVSDMPLKRDTIPGEFLLKGMFTHDSYVTLDQDGEVLELEEYEDIIQSNFFMFPLRMNLLMQSYSLFSSSLLNEIMSSSTLTAFIYNSDKRCVSSFSLLSHNRNTYSGFPRGCHYS